MSARGVNREIRKPLRVSCLLTYHITSYGQDSFGGCTITYYLVRIYFVFNIYRALDFTSSSPRPTTCFQVFDFLLFCCGKRCIQCTRACFFFSEHINSRSTYRTYLRVGNRTIGIRDITRPTRVFQPPYYITYI